MYTESDLAKLDTETIQRIRGEVEDKDLIHIPRAQLFQETKLKLSERPNNNVWEVGYWSTDDEEDNDSDYDPDNDDDGDDEEYDEEEEDDDEDDEEYKDEDKPRVDPTEMIKQERYERSLQPEERKYLLQVSDIERRIMQKNQFFERRKKVCCKESDFKWWSYDDRETSFCLTTKRKSTYKRGEQIFNCYGRRSNKFLLIL